MAYKALGALMLLVSILMQECDVSLFDLVVSYEVTVQNAGTAPAFISVKVSDLTRGAYVAPGHSASVTSFAGGKYSIGVVPWDESAVAAQDKEGAEIEAKLEDPDALSPPEVKALTERLRVLGNLAALRQIGAGSATCIGELKEDKSSSKRAVAVLATATNKGIQWSLSGC